MTRCRRTVAALLATAALAGGGPARAGGYDSLPDQGGQALGRGAAFTAKADDATAIYYNVAGLARQRGTKLQLGANVQFNAMSFTRAGEYPDARTDETPWGGTPFPTVEDKSNPFALPILLLTTDFGVFDRLTFGLGVFGPAASSYLFQTGVDGKPSPARYDAGGAAETSVLFPTLAAAYRLTPQIDVGAAIHLAVGSFDVTQIVFADSGGCPNVEAFTCDAKGRFQGEGGGLSGSIGALARVAPWLQVGAQVRGPTALVAEGTTTQQLGTTTLDPSPTRLDVTLPMTIRAGVRYIGLEGKREAYDVELDGVYGTHSGPRVQTTVAGAERTIEASSGWKNTFGVRLGGAYNVPLDEDVLSLRAGGYYESPTTDEAYTSLGSNTLAKVAGTLGLGYKHGAFAFNLAYAAVSSISRVVTNGELRLSNVLASDDEALEMPVTNNGEYKAFSHVLGFSIEVNFSTLLSGKERRSRYGDPAVEILADDAPAEPKGDDAGAPASAPAEPSASEEPAREAAATEETPAAPAAESPAAPKVEPAAEEEEEEEPKPKPKPKKAPKKKPAKKTPPKKKPAKKKPARPR